MQTLGLGAAAAVFVLLLAGCTAQGTEHPAAAQQPSSTVPGGLAGVMVHPSSEVASSGPPAYKLTATAVNHGSDSYQYQDGCAWRFRIENAAGESIPYAGRPPCSDGKAATLAPGASDSGGETWDGTWVDQGGNRETVTEGDYTWVATFSGDAGSATERLTIHWPPPG